MKHLLLITIFFFTAKMFAQSKAEIEVSRAVELLRNLMINPDSDQLHELLSDQVSYGHSSGKVENKTQFINNLLNGNSDFVDISLEDQHITFVKNTAIVRHRLSAKTNDNGVPGSLKLHIMTVWVKHKKWKLLARQAVKLPE